MEWIRTQETSLPHFKSTVMTIGNFDGFHLGHQKLIHELLSKAQFHHTQSVVLTFRPHPKVILKPNEIHHRLFDHRDQFEVLKKMGVDFLIEEKFSKDFSLMTAEEFLENYVEKIFKPVHLIVGYDFNFGHSRSGNANSLNNFCSRKGWGFTQVAAIEKDGQIVSSSAIRNLLEHGDLQKAKDFLGRAYYLRGPVRVGHKRGRKIGVPTANLSPEIDFIPRKGVYFTWVYWKNRKYASITNIGFNPTFDIKDSYLRVETHIFDFNEDIYGEQITVELVQFHRDEIKFPSIDDLKNQIGNDIFAARNFFANQ